MAVSKYRTTGALTALIASLSLAVAPASAQERGRWQERSAAQSNSHSGDSNPHRGNARAERHARAERNANAPQAQPRSDAMRHSQQVDRQQPQPRRGYNQPGAPWSPPEARANRYAPTVQQQQQPNRRNPNNGGQQWNDQRRQQLDGANRTSSTQAQTESWRNRRNASESDPWGVERDPEWRRDNPRPNGDAARWNNTNRQGWNGNRNNTWNNNNRNNWSNNRGNWNNDRRGYAQNHRWNHGWRNDNRYNWHSYRNTNRNVYRLGNYYAPYRGYSYRRLNSGFFLDSLFFSNRYWINDPWQYRLPAADGPYRWIRYYDDVLLVDTYSGEVVDVIYDFFW